VAPRYRKRNRSNQRNAVNGCQPQEVARSPYGREKEKEKERRRGEQSRGGRGWVKGGNKRGRAEAEERQKGRGWRVGR
jgi:hypothetical protein